MTWVLGLTGYPSGGYLFSDIRITLNRGGRLTPCRPFGVRKVHWIAPNVAAGFAGSIEIGFGALRDLRDFANAGLPEDAGVITSKLVYYWRRRIRRAWAATPSARRVGGLQLIVVGASPPKTIPFMSSYGFIMRAPEFELERLAVWEARAIGSGTAVAALERERARIREEIGNLVKMEIGDLRQSAIGPVIAHSLGDAITEAGEPTVSENLHVTRIRFGEVLSIANDSEVIGEVMIPGLEQKGAPTGRLMPTAVANTWAEFVQMARAAGIDVGTATA